MKFCAKKHLFGNCQCFVEQIRRRKLIIFSKKAFSRVYIKTMVLKLFNMMQENLLMLQVSLSHESQVKLEIRLCRGGIATTVYR